MISKNRLPARRFILWFMAIQAADDKIHRKQKKIRSNNKQKCNRMKKSVNNLIVLSITTLLLSCGMNEQKSELLDPLVQTQAGPVQGLVNEANDVVSFKGIPYADPPVGDLRWKEPQPLTPWEEVRDASEFCASCIQNRAYSREPWTEEFMVQNDISENCLFLNIWTAAKTDGEKLPVLVYIHGGGFNEGSGGIAVYDGENLAKKGIIVVTINYRLGALGFLAHPELTAESPNHSSGNYGFLDQIAALQWVKENISAFGGDPETVTIAGQSAGAMSVNQLVTSPLASGLFHRAITESGTSFASGFIGNSPVLSDAEQIGLDFAKQKGAANMAELRALSAEEILAPVEGQGMLRFRGNIDGYLQTADMKTIFAEGKQNDTPFMTGLNADKTRYTGVQEGTFNELYPSNNEEETAAAVKLAAQEQSRMNAWLWLEYRSKTAKTNGYVYYFDRAIPWPEHPEFGAFHTAEVPYVFNNMVKVSSHVMTEKDTLIADQISSYWVNFVKTGDPNGSDLASWNPYTAGKPEVMQLGEDFGMIPVAGTQEKFDFLKNQLLGN